MNKANLDKLIAFLHKQPAKQCIMGQYVKIDRNLPPEKSCGTAYCIAGWATLLSGKDPNRVACMANGSAFLGLEPNFINPFNSIPHQLFQMTGMKSTLDQFDCLEPERRKQIMIEVLSTLRETGEIDWNTYAGEIEEAWIANPPVG